MRYPIQSATNTDPHAAAAPRALHRTLTIVLGALTVAAVLLRCVAIAEPLGIDQSLWASAARAMARGQFLYQDVWEQRPPGIYWLYLTAFRTFGWQASTVAWLDILAVAVTTVLLYALARSSSGPVAAALAASLYVTLTMPAWLYSHAGFLERSVCETFIVVCVGLGAVAVLRYRDRAPVAAAFLAGLFVGAAIVLKPNAALYLPALLAWLLVYRGDGVPDSRVLGHIGLAAAGGAMVLPGVTVAWLWHLGVLPDAYVAIIEFNRFYVGEGFTLSGYALAFSKAVWLRIKTDPLWLAGCISAVLAVTVLVKVRRLPPLAGLAVLWGGAAAMVIVVNGARLYNSYFIQALAPLALLSAWMLGAADHRRFGTRIVPIATGVLMAALLVQRGYTTRVLGWARADFEVLSGRSSPVRYLERFGGYSNGRGYSARANEELARYVRQRTSPADRIFLFGINGAGIYFAADRLPAHRFLRVNFFVATTFPDPRFRLDAVLDDLGRTRPRYVIFERLHSGSEMASAADALPLQPAVARLLRAYRLETQIEDFTLYRRVD